MRRLGNKSHSVLLKARNQFKCNVHLYLPEWERVSLFIHCQLHFGLVSVNFTTITVSYTFKRRLGYYLLQVFVPDILIVLISWIVFWMSPDNAGDRLTIGITTILTIMFLSGAINASMPPVSYAKALDWYLLVSFGFIFFSVIESLVVFLLSSQPLKRGCSCKKDGMVSKQQTTIFLFDMLLLFNVTCSGVGFKTSS